MKNKLPMRQVHLDFHTSPDIENIAGEFDSERFAKKLKNAGVNSITCFSRCHHGNIYYDSKEFPERIHPHLQNKNLLKEQIEACHAEGIRVPIYITVQWDKYTAEEHPEWLMVDETGKPYGNKLYQAGFYNNLCVNTPYRDMLKRQTKEVLEMFTVDGLFFDIVQEKECSCSYCRQGMLEEGLNPAEEDDRKKYAHQMMIDFQKDMTNFIRQYNQECTIFFNKGHIGPEDRDGVEAYTHYEVESLPSGGWGYMFFPITVRYARTLGKDCLGMTGKFHTFWGDFHSFKNKEALEYECFQMLAQNAGCSIGDQMEPHGVLSDPVYELIASVYNQVEKKEPWCVEAETVTEIAVFNPEEFLGTDIGKMPSSLIGTARILQETAYQFDIIDSKAELDKYKLLILPDEIEVNDTFAEKLENYLEQGGKIIASYKSGLYSEKGDFNLDLAVKYVDDAFYSPDYIYPEGKIGKGLPQTEHVMYKRGLEVLAEGENVLSYTKVPYFNRTWKHFCSHKHTPSSGDKGYPAVVATDNTIYFSHPIFSQYNENSPLWCKKLVENALEMLLAERLISHDGPSTLQMTINHQPSKKRYVVHLLHYIPERRSERIDIIEDVIPLFDIKLACNLPHEIMEVSLVPEEEELSFKDNNGVIEFNVPKISGHQMVELSYN